MGPLLAGNSNKKNDDLHGESCGFAFSKQLARVLLNTFEAKN
jgi:hypothetical protein